MKYKNFILVAATALSALIPQSVWASPEQPLSSIPVFRQEPARPPAAGAYPGEKLLVWIGGKDTFNDKTARQTALDTFNENPSLSSFFSPQEKMALAIRSETEFRTKVGTILKPTDIGRTVDVLGTQIASDIANQILTKVVEPPTLEPEEKRDPKKVKEWERQIAELKSRRAEWVAKIVSFVHDCTSKTSTMDDALYCKDAFTATLPQNIGLAIFHEIYHANLATSTSDPGGLLKKLDASFRHCATAQSSDIEFCVRSTVKSGISEVAQEQVRARLTPHFKTKTNLDYSLSMIKINFDSCLKKQLIDKKAQKEGVVVCVDALVKDAGTHAIHERIINEPGIAEFYPTAADRIALSSQYEKMFQSCIAKQVNNKKRDGVVPIADPCENQVVNAATYDITMKTIRVSVRENLEHPNDAAAVTQSAQATLDGCWDPYQQAPAKEACLRTTVSSIASDVARITLDAEIPADFAKARPAARNTYLSTFKGCLNEELPILMTEAKDLSGDIERCSAPLRRQAALEVADFSIHALLDKKVPDATATALVQKLVKEDFAQCLGKMPTDKVSAKCVFQIKKNAAKAIGGARFPIETRSLMPIGNSLEEDAIFAKMADAASAEIVSEYRECIDQNLHEDQPKGVDAEIDTCSKSSVQRLALFAADVQIDNKVAGMYGDNVQGLIDLKQQLSNELSSCMKASEKLDLSKYVDAAVACGNRISERGVIYVARDQLARVLREIEKRERTAGHPTDTGAQTLPECRKGPEAMVELTASAQELLKTMADIIGSYIDYDLKTAKKDITKILTELRADLQSVGSSDTRRKLLNWLVNESAALDQLMKAMTRDQVIAGFNAMPEKERPSKELLARLTDKKVFDEIFASPRGKTIRQNLVGDMLEPVLLGDMPLQSDYITDLTTALKSDVKNLLVDSAQFGGTLLDGSVKQQIKDMPWYTKALARAALGSSSLNWDKVKTTPKGIEASNYIRDQIVRPLVRDEKVPEQEMAARKKKAEELVKKAVYANSRWK